MYALVMNCHDCYGRETTCDTHFYGLYETHQEAREHMNDLVNAHMADWMHEAENEGRNSRCESTLAYDYAILTDGDTYDWDDPHATENFFIFNTDSYNQTFGNYL